MAKKTFKTDLSVKGIKNLQKQLIAYQKNDLQQKVDLLAKTLADKGVNFAQVNVARLDAIFTGELISSIHTEFGESGKGKTVFYVVADSSHAVFVEFGTLGSIGGKQEYPYPFPEGVEWNYGSGKHIIQRENGEYGWFYKGDDGKVYWSSGMDARPFMYETAMELRQIVEETAKGIFRK